MPPVVAAAWTGTDCLAGLHRALDVGEEIHEQRHFGTLHLQAANTAEESALAHSRRVKEVDSGYSRSIAETVTGAARAKVQEGGSMADRCSLEQDVKTEQNPTASSPASFASQEERQGRSADVPFSGPTYSEPTPGLFGSGLSARVHQTHRKRKRKDMPVFHIPSLGGASAGGACDHCGRKNSPAWRRGPPNKPHLCNACGVRFLGKGTLDGYMPGMKQHKDDHLKEDVDHVQGDDEVYDDTDSAKTTMPQLSGKAVSRRQRTPRRMATPRSDMVSGPAAAGDAESDGEEAGSIATWSDYIKKAVETNPENWRKVVTLIKAAIRVAKADPSTSQNVLTELERAQALFWMDKDAALKVLSNVAEADMLLTLSGGQVNDHVGRQSRGTPPAGSEEDGGACFAYCGACCKPRLTSWWPAVYEDFRCGGAAAVHPERSCLAPADIISGSPVAPSPMSSLHKRPRLTPTSGANTKTIAGGEYRSDLDMLAGVVVEGTIQPKGRGKRAARAMHSPNGRGQSFLDTFQRADEGAHFMTLPIGWRMEVAYERVAGGKGVAVETVYVSPNRTRFKSMAEVVTWLTSSSNRARLLAGPAAATFTPGPAFHRSPSGSVLVSHSGGTGSPKAENLVPPPTSPRMSRADLSLTHLAAIAGQTSREASPLPGGGGLAVQSPSLGIVGRTMAAMNASSPTALAANAGPQDQGDAFTFRHGSEVAGTPTIVTPIVTLRRPEQAMLPNVKIVVAPARPLPQFALSASPPTARQSRSHVREPESTPVGVKVIPPASLWKQKSEPAAVLHEMSREAKRRPEEVVREPPAHGVVAAAPKAPELKTPDLPATRPQTIGRWRTFPPNGAAAGDLKVERDSKKELTWSNTQSAECFLPVAKEEGSFDLGFRSLSRCVSEPASAIKGYAADSKISWTGVVRIQKGDNSSEDLCTMLANLPEEDAVHLPGNLFISSFKPRNDIFMAAVTEHPWLLHLGPCTEKQRETLLKMEEEKVAAVVQLEAFDFALIPHINRKNGLHIVGLKLQHKGSAAVGSTSPSGSGSPGVNQHPLFQPLNSGLEWPSRLSPAPASADVPPSSVRPPALFHGHPRRGG